MSSSRRARGELTGLRHQNDVRIDVQNDVQCTLAHV